MFFYFVSYEKQFRSEIGYAGKSQIFTVCWKITNFGLNSANVSGNMKPIAI